MQSARTHGLGWRTAHASSIDEKGLIYIFKATSAPPRAGTTGISHYISHYIPLFLDDLLLFPMFVSTKYIIPIAAAFVAEVNGKGRGSTKGLSGLCLVMHGLCAIPETIPKSPYVYG